MSLISYKRGQGSIVLRVKILNSSVTTGAGLTGLTSASSGLIISTIADNEASATAYTVAGSTIETITTLGTYAAPTATKCRFKEVDATNHKGVYEIQIADARYAVSSAKSLLVSILGATNAAETDCVIPLTDMDPYDAVHGGMSALPNTACTTNASLLTSGTGTDQISVSAGKVLLQATQTGVTIPTVTTVTNQLTAGAIATGVWQDATAGDFTTAGSIGKSLFTSGNVPGAAGGLFLSGSNAATTIDTLTVTNTTTLSGAVSLGSTLAIAGTTTLAALTTTGTATLNALTVSGATTLTGAVTASNASNNIVGIDVAKISGDATAADNLELEFDGTGYAYVTDSGTAQAGASSTITLKAGSSGTDDYYSHLMIRITGGTGAGQVRVINGYVGATKVATVSPAWSVSPDGTSTYLLLSSAEVHVRELHAGAIDAASFASGALDAVWSTATRTLTAGTNIQLPSNGLANVTAWTVNITGSLSGSVGSVTGAVGSVTGAVGSVTTVSNIATAVLTTQMTESYRATNTAPTLAQAQFELIAHMGESSISGTTKTTKKLDGATTAKTYTLNDATTPTSITEAT